jgi:hypothetical protein
MEEHNEKIGAEAGKGTSFYLELPVRKASTVAKKT